MCLRFELLAVVMIGRKICRLVLFEVYYFFAELYYFFIELCYFFTEV